MGARAGELSVTPAHCGVRVMNWNTLRSTSSVRITESSMKTKNWAVPDSTDGTSARFVPIMYRLTVHGPAWAEIQVGTASDEPSKPVRITKSNCEVGCMEAPP